jgi:DNA-directed RNA polymerase specialized sigma24 family protein
MANASPAPPLEQPAISCEKGDAYRLARRQGLTHEDAEEVAQDTRLRVWQAGPTPVHPGLRYCIAKRVLASFLRREFAEKRDRRRLVRLDADPGRSDPAGESRRPELEPRRVLDRLTRNQEGNLDVRVLRLRLEGNSYRTIAERIGRRVHDVTNCLHRIKKTLRARVAHLSRSGDTDGQRTIGTLEED